MTMMSRRSFAKELLAGVAVAPVLVKTALASLAERGVVALADSSYQTGYAIVVTPLMEALQMGDILTVGDLDAIDRVSGKSTGKPRQFVVTATSPNGATVIPIYPPIIPPMMDGSTAERQTVASQVKNRAEVRCHRLDDRTSRSFHAALS